MSNIRQLYYASMIDRVIASCCVVVTGYVVASQRDGKKPDIDDKP